MRRTGHFSLRSIVVSCVLMALVVLGLAARAGESGAGMPAEATLLRIAVMDIGQGDGIAIRAPNGKTVLIDSGPTADQALLLKQLGRLGVQQIDLAVESHPHEDHIGGFAAVLQKYPVKVFTDPGTIHTTSTYRNLLQQLKEKKVPTRVARKGQRYKIDEGVYLDILAPREPLLEGTKSDLNNNSTIARLTYGDFSMLFQGDAEVEAEDRLVEDKIPPTTVLKVGHHGSHSSSTAQLVDMIKPQAAVLSCEVGNDYGHPHAKTLKTMQSRSIKLYRTDQDGQVRFLTNGRQLWVETFSRNSLASDPSSGDPTPTRIDGPIQVRPASPDSRVATGTGGAASGTGSGTSRGVPATGDEGSSQGGATASSAGHPDAGAAEEGGYVASQKSKVFHKASCGNGKRISEQNRVIYASREEAIGAGKEPAKDCHP